MCHNTRNEQARSHDAANTSNMKQNATNRTYPACSVLVPELETDDAPPPTTLGRRGTTKADAAPISRAAQRAMALLLIREGILFTSYASDLLRPPTLCKCIS